jgi:hypothetical protein
MVMTEVESNRAASSPQPAPAAVELQPESAPPLVLSEERPPPAGGLPQPSVVPLEQQRETLRGRIAAALLGILAFIVVAAFLTIWFDWADDGELTDLLTLIFAPVLGLVGAVTGFYYGEKVNSSRT